MNCSPWCDNISCDPRCLLREYWGFIGLFLVGGSPLVLLISFGDVVEPSTVDRVGNPWGPLASHQLRYM